MIFVQLYGILVYAVSPENASASFAVMEEAIRETVESKERFSAEDILWDLAAVVRDVVPILAVIFFFQYMVIKKAVAHLHKITVGIFMVILGLYAFILGLEMGLFPIGETIAFQLTAMKNDLLIYLFGFLIGFSTTMAEPALLAIAIKAQEVSEGRINQGLLRTAVALGVAVGIALGAYRIVVGDQIHYYIIAVFTASSSLSSGTMATSMTNFMRSPCWGLVFWKRSVRRFHTP